MQQNLRRIIERFGLRRQTKLERLAKRNDWLRELMTSETANVDIAMSNENGARPTDNSIH